MGTRLALAIVLIVYGLLAILAVTGVLLVIYFIWAGHQNALAATAGGILTATSVGVLLSSVPRRIPTAIQWVAYNIAYRAIHPHRYRSQRIVRAAIS